MRPLAPILFLWVCAAPVQAQVTTPQIKARFGVDADLRSNYFNGSYQDGSDDWFTYPGSVGSGDFVIDTSGAAAMLARYATDPNYRKLPFYRVMRYSPYSVVNNQSLIDAVFIRDYHGSDSTVFSSGSKNGMSPANWSCPVAQSVPDKNDALDLAVHVRREGPDASYALWLFGGLSIENTTGDRYFDFEMYQTDIFYDRATQQFSGYGPDAGHTSWKFDSAGNVLQPGDIIFSADYSSSSLSSLEARIWVDSSALSLTPTRFDWSGSFDGAGNNSRFGYAGIKPKGGVDFYSGMECSNNTWAGPFGFIHANNNLDSVYTAGQFMEFAVNLTTLGLDPVNLLGSNACGMPFRKILVKTRSSTSFTAALKDFVGPFDFFLAPKAQAAADIPLFCGTTGLSTIQVSDPDSTSLYTWSTSDGHILGSDSGTSIQVDEAGTYVVEQILQAGCSTYASDTVTIAADPNCSVLSRDLLSFQGRRNTDSALLSWTFRTGYNPRQVDIQRSTDGKAFRTVASYAGIGQPVSLWHYDDPLQNFGGWPLWYRIRLTSPAGNHIFSQVVYLEEAGSSRERFVAFADPLTGSIRLRAHSEVSESLQWTLYTTGGQNLASGSYTLQAGNHLIDLTRLPSGQRGLYILHVFAGADSKSLKVLFE